MFKFLKREYMTWDEFFVALVMNVYSIFGVMLLTLLIFAIAVIAISCVLAIPAFFMLLMII